MQVLISIGIALDRVISLYLLYIPALDYLHAK